MATDPKDRMSSSTTDGRSDAKAGRRKTKKRDENVIHVAFGRGGGRLAPGDVAADAAAKPGAPANTVAPSHPPPPLSGEPVTDLFTARDVEKLLGLTTARLRTLDRSQIVSPTGERHGKRCYTFQDLIALRATHGLLGGFSGMHRNAELRRSISRRLLGNL